MNQKVMAEFRSAATSFFRNNDFIHEFIHCSCRLEADKAFSVLFVWKQVSLKQKLLSSLFCQAITFPGGLKLIDKIAYSVKN